MLDVLRTIGAALGLDLADFFRARADGSAVSVAAWVALLAGASTMLGHLAILMLNRIRNLRLVTSMLLSAGTLAALYLVQAAVTWGVASLVLRRPLDLFRLLIVAMLALAPLVFNFVTALPHFGLGIGRVLEAWSYLILWLGVAHVFRISWLWALGFTLAGWLTMQLLSRLLQRPLNWFYSKLWTLATGRPTMVTSRDILAGMPIIPVEADASEVAA